MSVILVEHHEAVALVTLNRPESRNALNSELLRAIRETMSELGQDDAVAAIVLTGADPAFCAGLDLKQLGSTGENLAGPGPEPNRGPDAPWPRLPKPVIGAINGAAVTGGLEIALRCDFLIASERARFADTHARVGLLPGWGLSVLLPQAVGLRKAKEMSLTGNFVKAEEAFAFGLVNRVVAHDDLAPTALALAADIAGNDRTAVAALLAEYDEVTSTTVADGLQIEADRAREWNRSGEKLGDVERRRTGIVERGRSQV